MADQRFGEERYDRYRQDEYRTEDYRTRGDPGRDTNRYGGRGYEGSDRGGYGAGSTEDRSFNEGGRDVYSGSASGGSYGEDRGYGSSAYGSSAYGRNAYGRSDKPWYGHNEYSRDYSADNNGPAEYGPQYNAQRGDHRYSNRQAAGAMLHQGYRAPFGDRSGFDRNDFHRYEGEGQRYQFNNYEPTHDQTGRFAHGSSYSADQGRDRGVWDQTRDEVSSWFGDDEAARRRKLDAIRADHHGGKGPKSYTRSDDRIREDINDRLTDDYQLDASDIEVKVDKGEVTLTGEVGHRADKRRAEDLADAIGGVKHVQNNLRVKDQASSGAFSASSGVAQTNSTTTGSTTGSSTNRSN